MVCKFELVSFVFAFFLVLSLAGLRVLGLCFFWRRRPLRLAQEGLHRRCLSAEGHLSFLRPQYCLEWLHRQGLRALSFALRFLISSGIVPSICAAHPLPIVALL